MSPPSKLASLDVSVDTGVYHAGDIVEGQVRVRVARELLVRHVRVFLYGECAFRNVDETPSSGRLWERSVDLWRGVSDCFLPPGSYSFRFSLGTPVSLPTGWEGGGDALLGLPSTSSSSPSPLISHLKYFVEVRIIESERETTAEHVKRRQIRIEGVCLEWPDAASEANVAREVAYVRNVFDASGTIGATLKLNRGWGLPGTSLYANVEVLNCFRRLSVELRLVERLLAISAGTPFTSRAEEEVIYSRQLGSLKSGEAYRRWLGVDVWIPDESLVPFRARAREKTEGNPIVRRISRGIFLQLRVKSGVLSQTLSIALPICLIADIRYLPLRLRNGTRLSGAATI